MKELCKYQVLYSQYGKEPHSSSKVSIYLSIYLSTYLSIYLSIYLYIYIFMDMFVEHGSTCVMFLLRVFAYKKNYGVNRGLIHPIH